MVYVPVAEASKTIRAQLKSRLGLTSKDVSVRSSSYSMGSSINVEIKTPRASLVEIDRIANGSERIDRDANGEILSGGNRYVFVKYDDDVLEPIRKRFESLMKSGAREFDGWTVGGDNTSWRAWHPDLDDSILSYFPDSLALSMAIKTLGHRLPAYPAELARSRGADADQVRADWREERGIPAPVK